MQLPSVGRDVGSERSVLWRWGVCSCRLLAVALLLTGGNVLRAQPVDPEVTRELQTGLRQFEESLNDLRSQLLLDQREQRQWLADVEICGKAIDWCLRHSEFYRPEYADHARRVLEIGRERIAAAAQGRQPVPDQPGSAVRAYFSQVDGSVQPYAVTLPAGFTDDRSRRWPLYVKLHGRNARLNEVSFIHSFDRKPPSEEQTWIQLDVFGRTNNAYRWSGEKDVFEALEDVQRRFAIDRRRITLHGFSMGGAGAWHLGLHYPSMWSSVGPGAGFVDFYEYQGVTEQLPGYQHRTLGIYDAVDYALNAHNVPVCTYGGELDKQLLASTTMVDAAKRLDVPIKLLVGPGTGHKFHPDSLQEFMAFHKAKSEAGRPAFPGSRHIRFTTRTLKYNQCDWVTIEEIGVQYEPAVIDARIDRNGDVEITTRNIDTLQLAREAGSYAIIDGDQLPLNSAADGLLPGVYYQRTSRGWQVMSYDESREFSKNPDGRKRHGLQGPIDDAFMEPFVCVRGTGDPWSAAMHDWSHWSLSRFEGEYDKWLRATVPVVDDTALSEADISSKNLVLFGDPGSNRVLAELLPRLPVEWSRDSITVGGRTYSTAENGLALIFPNPLNTQRYVVINSGHTFHAKDFEASNAWLFPRLGDIAVIRFAKSDDGYTESTVWADLFNSAWRLPSDSGAASDR